MTREEFLALANEQYDKVANLQSEKTFYAYKEGFANVWTESGGRVMQASLKKGSSKDKRKKTVLKLDSGKYSYQKAIDIKLRTFLGIMFGQLT